ncbi:unnamed protein product [Urochloa humidicola]
MEPATASIRGPRTEKKISDSSSSRCFPGVLVRSFPSQHIPHPLEIPIYIALAAIEHHPQAIRSGLYLQSVVGRRVQLVDPRGNRPAHAHLPPGPREVEDGGRNLGPRSRGSGRGGRRPPAQASPPRRTHPPTTCTGIAPGGGVPRSLAAIRLDGASCRHGSFHHKHGSFQKHMIHNNEFLQVHPLSLT